MRSISEHLQSLWLAITLSAIPHGALGGDSPPVPSSPTPPMHPSASANTDASAPFTSLALPKPPGISHETLKAAWEGQACECFQVGQAWEQTGDYYNRAAKWYRLSAEQGYALAQANLAMLYEHNRVMPDSASIKKSGLSLPDGRKVESNDITLLDLRWYVQHELKQARTESEAGRVKRLSDRWIHLQENLAEAIHWYHQAAQQGHADAQYNLGRIYLRLAKDQLHPQDTDRLPQDQLHQFSTVPPPAFYHQGKPDDLVIRWTRDANHKDAEAQYQLGLLHFHGVDGTPNLARAARLWQSAAELKHHAAENALAWLEAQGIGVALNTESAARRYRRLAYYFLEAAGKRGVRDAWLALGHVHLELVKDAQRRRQFRDNSISFASNPDFRAARLFFERAAQSFKHPVTDKNANVTVIAGKYGLPSAWLKAANPEINRDDLSVGEILTIPGAPEAMLMLGQLALEDAGQPRNEALAAKWFAQAIPYNPRDAHFLLGYLHHVGKGVALNLKKAQAHYEKAADLNHRMAQYNLGLLYYKARRGNEELPPRRLQLSLKTKRKPTRYNLLNVLLPELQFVDDKELRKNQADTIQYVPDPMHQHDEVLQVESSGPERDKEIEKKLRDAFPKAIFERSGSSNQPDPLWHVYDSEKKRRADCNKRAWHWWKIAGLNRLEEARIGREFLEKFIEPSQLKEANATATQQYESLIQISQPRKQGLTILPQPFSPVTWAAGFMITMDGYLITSQDIVAMGKRFRVKTESGATFEARVVDATRILNGVALLKVDGDHQFRPLPLASARTVHEQEEVYVVGYKPLKKLATSPEACSILTHVANMLGNQADPRFLTLSENVLGDRLFLRFNKYVDSRRTPASTKHFEGQAAAEKRSLETIAATMIAHNENLARSQTYGYRLAQELWHDPVTGQWHESHGEANDIHFTQGKFVVVDGKLVRTPPPADKLEHGGLPLLRILAPSGLALQAEKVLRKTYWEAGFERDSFQPGLRGMALLNRHGQAVAIHYPPLRPDADHDYPNFNTYDRFALKADALISALRQRTELRLDESRPIEPSITPALRLTSHPGDGLESLRPGTWTPPSTRFSSGAHTHPDPLVRTNLNACNLTLECVDSPMLSRARASLVLVQVAE